jgi:hypothetical protein
VTDLELMQSIHTKYGAAIEFTCKQLLHAGGPGVSPSFVAALIANESGGNLAAKRFEKGVLIDLWDVLMGRSAAYGSIGAQDLWTFLANSPVISPFNIVVSDAVNRLDALATSWGLTQIMGYEVFDFSAVSPTIDKLQTVDGGLQLTLLMLAKFAARFQFDLATDAKDMFDCWNTGRPNVRTFDPQYIPNGLRRMALYQGILAAESAQ